MAWGGYTPSRIGKESEDNPNGTLTHVFQNQSLGIFIGHGEVMELSIGSKRPGKGGERVSGRRDRWSVR